MPKFEPPDDQERRILEENHMDPNVFTVMFRDETTIHLRNYDTRDDVTIHKGDRPW